jgi:peptide/nickel transport system substrate-binding protein
VTGYVVENDGRPWRLTLRDGLRFHDGEPERARDFFGLALMQATDEVSAADDRTIVFRLNKHFSLLPDAPAKPASRMCPIMPVHRGW